VFTNADSFFGPRVGSLKRRTKSQIVYNGSDSITANEQNKQLIQDLYALKKQLKVKDDTIEKLNDVRNKLESEIQELSASLFEEAHAMVNAAKAEKLFAEKLLKEARGKIDVLQDEIKLLKELVLKSTSTPHPPNRHSLPRQALPAAAATTSAASAHFRKTSLNHQTLGKMLSYPSAMRLSSSINKLSEPSPPSSVLTSTPSATSGLSAAQSRQHLNEPKAILSDQHTIQRSLLSNPHKSGGPERGVETATKSFIDKFFNSDAERNASVAQEQPPVRVESEQLSSSREDQSNKLQINPIYLEELSVWKQKPETTSETSFLRRIYSEDILPCLDFSDEKTNRNILASIECNSVCIEEIASIYWKIDDKLQICGLSNIPSVCQYKIKLNENSSWILISKLSRNRIIAVCDFFAYLRYIKDGLVKCEIHSIYRNIINLRKNMSLSRLGVC